MDLGFLVLQQCGQRQYVIVDANEYFFTNNQPVPRNTLTKTPSLSASCLSSGQLM